MSEYDEFFDIVFRDFMGLVRAASAASGRSEALSALGQIEEDGRADAGDELIVGRGDVTYLAPARGLELEEVEVRASEDELEVKTPDYTFRKRPGVRIDPESVRVSVANGLLCVRVRRREDEWK